MEKTAVNFSYAITVNTAPVSIYAVRADGTRTLLSTFTTTGQHTFLAQTPYTEIEGDYSLLTGPLTTAAVIGGSTTTLGSTGGGSGAPGQDGKDGKDGLSAYELAVQQGYTGGLDEWLASLKGEPGQDGASPAAEDVAAALLPMISSKMTYEGPAATNNWHASYFQLGENYLPQDAALLELGYRVRFDSINGCTTDPVYLGVWERTETGDDWELRGVSLNTQVQGLSMDAMWQFDPAAVRLSGRPIRCCLLATREDGWRTDLTMGMRVSDVSDSNTSIVLNEQSWQKAPKFFLTAYKPVDLSGGAYAPASHVSDTTAHLTADEHSKLTALLQNGGSSGSGNSSSGNSSSGNSGGGNFEDTGHILGGTATFSTCTATGYNARATGNDSTATGYFAQATGDATTATGYGAQATSYGSTATGYFAQATGDQSTATGYGAQATGDDSTATGNDARATGDGSIATGAKAHATGYGSTATGYCARATGDGSTATGHFAQALAGEHVLRAGNSKNYACLKIASPFSEVSRSQLDNESGLGYAENSDEYRYIKLSALFDLVEAGGSSGSGSIEVQQTYDPASEAALSGKAVAEALQKLRQDLAAEGLIATTREVELLNTPVGNSSRIDDIRRVYLNMGYSNNSPISKNGGFVVTGVKLLVMKGLWDMRIDDPQSWEPTISVNKITSSVIAKSLEQSPTDYPAEVQLYVTGKIVDIQEMWSDYWMLEIAFDKPIIVSITEFLALGSSAPFSTEPCLPDNTTCYIYTTARTVQAIHLFYTLIVKE